VDREKEGGQEASQVGEVQEGETNWESDLKKGVLGLCINGETLRGRAKRLNSRLDTIRRLERKDDGKRQSRGQGKRPRKGIGKRGREDLLVLIE